MGLTWGLHMAEEYKQDVPELTAIDTDKAHADRLFHAS